MGTCTGWIGLGRASKHPNSSPRPSKNLIGENMSKVLETKKAIVDLLSQKGKTLTDLSNLLSLSPSTINQHLKELEQLGAVKLAEDQHSRKWKYYDTVPGFSFG